MKLTASLCIAQVALCAAADHQSQLRRRALDPPSSDFELPPVCCEDRKWFDYPGKVRCATKTGEDCCIAMCEHPSVSYGPVCCKDREPGDYVGRVRCTEDGRCCTALCSKKKKEKQGKSSSTVTPTTTSPTPDPTITSTETLPPTFIRPTVGPTTIGPTVDPTITSTETLAPTTVRPTVGPTTIGPTVDPTTVSPTEEPPICSPTLGPTDTATEAISGSWQRAGSDIGSVLGLSSNSFGDIFLSADGKTLVVSKFPHSPTGLWALNYTDADAETEGEKVLEDWVPVTAGPLRIISNFRPRIVMSGNGQVIAVAVGLDVKNYKHYNGVRIFELDASEGSWKQVGSDIVSEAIYELDNWNNVPISLADDGRTVAIAGYKTVSVFELAADREDWVQKGETMNSHHFSGSWVRLSADGQRLLYPVFEVDLENYYLSMMGFDSNTKDWLPLGDIGHFVDIVPKDAASLSADGRVVSFFDPGHGVVRVIEFVEEANQHCHLGNEISFAGSDFESHYSKTVALNSDGTVLAVGMVSDPLRPVPTSGPLWPGVSWPQKGDPSTMIRVYKLEQGQWIPRGSEVRDTNDEGPEYIMIDDMHLSGDGLRVAARVNREPRVFDFVSDDSAADLPTPGPDSVEWSTTVHPSGIST